MVTYRQARSTDDGCRQYYVWMREIARQKGITHGVFKQRVIDHVLASIEEDKDLPPASISKPRRMAWYSHVVAYNCPPQD